MLPFRGFNTPFARRRRLEGGACCIDYKDNGTTLVFVFKIAVEYYFCCNNCCVAKFQRFVGFTGILKLAGARGCVAKS